MKVTKYDKTSRRKLSLQSQTIVVLARSDDANRKVCAAERLLGNSTSDCCSAPH